MADKPPYTVPLMAEVHAVPQNGLVVASTFSGGGGSCTGYRMAGYRVAWANEFEPSAAATYRRNYPETVLDQRDIRTVKGIDVMEAAGVDELDLFDGSPPCQAFSMAGQRAKSWGRVMDHVDGTSQRSDDLFFEYARLLGEIRPRAFVAENVAGLVTGVARGYFKEIMAALIQPGYRVAARVLDSQWLGVPQARRRVIIVGIRDDVLGEPAYPSPMLYRYSIADACPWLDGRLSCREGYTGRKHISLDDPAPTIQVHAGMNAGNKLRFRPAVPEAGDDPTTPPAERFNQRPDIERPAPTILASNAGWSGMAVGERKLSIAEVKRLCSFPDDYVLEGTYNQQWARLGNSVPPLMMRSVAEALAPVLLASCSTPR